MTKFVDMRRLSLALGLLAVLVSHSIVSASQRPTNLSVLDFGDSAFAKRSAEKLRALFRATGQMLVLDPEMSGAAARGIGYSGSLNLTVDEARDLGAALASDFFVIGDAQTIRRSSSGLPTYYESYCSIFVVSSRTGRLVFWDRPSFRHETPLMAEERLSEHLEQHETVRRCLSAIKRAQEEERFKRDIAVSAVEPLIEEAPMDDKSAELSGLQLPRPYRRLRPEYPESAALADVEATVDVVVDVGADGTVGQVQVTRWAGFGLDEATVATVRQMHFFPAMKKGTAVAMRVLLRYNFRKPTR